MPKQNVVDLDLDVLVGQKRKIKIKDEIVEIEDPSLETMFRLAKLGSDIKKSQEDNKDDPEEVLEVFDQFIERFNKLFPEFGDKNLNLRQINALLGYIAQAVTPESDQTLAERGVKPDSDQKKTE